MAPLLPSLLLPVSLLLGCRAVVGTGDSGAPAEDRDTGVALLDGIPVACAPAEADCWTFASLPDFLNCDVASVAEAAAGGAVPAWDDGPDSTSVAWEAAMDQVLDEVAAAGPAFVLVAGDAVNGQWYKDADARGVFGPVDTWTEQAAAIDAAAAVYYPAWTGRFAARGLPVHLALGDHELGDNLWPVDGGKSHHVARLKERFADHATRAADGSPRYALRPEGSPQADTAYAFDHRPEGAPGLRVITLDVFRQDGPGVRLDDVEGSVLATVDGAQLAWLEDQLADAAADPDIAWVVVQGHTPVLGPVRMAWSSGMMLRDHDGTTVAAEADQGADTDLWRSLTAGGAALFLAGEVHDTTLTPSPVAGPVQVAHGAHLGRTSTFTWLLVHVRPDRLDLELREVTVDHEGEAIWQTGPRCSAGEPRILDPRPRVGGAARLRQGAGGVEVEESRGRLDPVPAGDPLSGVAGPG